MNINTVTQDSTNPSTNPENLTETLLLTHAPLGVLCPCCRTPLTAFVQPGLLPWHADVLMVQCPNAACVGATTLNLADWLALTMPSVDMAAGAAAVAEGAA